MKGSTMTGIRLSAAAMTGAALGCAFPEPGWLGLAWLAPAAFLLAVMGERGLGAFRIGWLGGFVYATISLRWLLNIPFPAGAIAGWLALSAYMALYPAFWVWWCLDAVPGVDGRGVRRQAQLSSMETIRGLVSAPWGGRAAWALRCGLAWVAGEMVLSRFMTGFPWNFLGVSQFPVTPLTQAASLAGPYLISGMIVWCSVALLCAALSIFAVWGRPVSGGGEGSSNRGAGRSALGPAWSAGGLIRSSAWVAEVAVPGLVLAALVAWGMVRIARFSASDRTVRVALIQPSIPQTLIWDRNEDGARFDRVIALSRLAAAARPELMVWPEAAMPSFNEDNYRAITNLASGSKFWMILGADDLTPRGGDPGSGEHDVYNAALLLNREGRFKKVYHKRRLVMFGEYVPLGRWLPFLRRLTPIGGDFSEGREPGFFELDDLRIRSSVLICFEDVFPHGVRESVDDETDWIVNLTNNGWFGEGSAQWQHAVNASFRAVENGIPLIRCTNNGLTCWVDPLGRMHEVEGGADRDIFGAGFKLAEVGVWERPGRAPTFYRVHGDLFGWMCVVLTCWASGLKYLQGGRRKTV